MLLDRDLEGTAVLLGGGFSFLRVVCILGAPLDLLAASRARKYSSVRVSGVGGLLPSPEGVTSLFSGLPEGVFGERKRFEWLADERVRSCGWKVRWLWLWL